MRGFRRVFELARALPREDPDRSRYLELALRSMGMAYLLLDDAPHAEECLRKALPLCEELDGPRSGAACQLRMALAVAVRAQGKALDAGLPAPGQGEAEDLERTRKEAVSARMRSERATDPARRARLTEIARLFVTQGGGHPVKDLARAKPG